MTVLDTTEGSAGDIWPPLPRDEKFLPFTLPPGAANQMWIDTELSGLPDEIDFALYPQTTRGADAQGSYLARLPPDYYTKGKRYPVMYWLHGGLSNSRQAQWPMQFYAKKMNDFITRKFIIVAPQILPQGRFMDSRDGDRPLGTIFVQDLITAVDARYNTIPHRTARWLEGFSMGGYGALHLAFKHPDLFGAVSVFAAGLIWKYDEENAHSVTDTFAGDVQYYNESHPYTLASANQEKLRDTAIRIVWGGDDTRLKGGSQRLAQRLEELGLKVQSQEVEGVGHVYPPLLAALGPSAWQFWGDLREKVVE